MIVYAEAMSFARLLSLALSAALLVGWAGPVAATNTTEDTPLRVTLHDGSVHEGRLTWKQSKLWVKGRKRRKIPYGDISMISAPPTPTAEELAAEFGKRAKGLGADDLKGWLRLARWAAEQDLSDEAAEAYEKALELDEQNAEARAGIGELKDGGDWVAAGVILGRKRQQLAADDHDGLVGLARFCFEHQLHLEGFDLLVQVLTRDTYHKDAIKLAKPYTRRYRQRSALRFPLAGRWKASEDKSRHHQLKAYATYALDLMKVDERGRTHRGRGRELSDYFTWDQPFYAVADGTVVEVRDGNPDNPVGQIGDAHEKHNGVSLDHGNGELSWYVHAKKGSIRVKLGDKVKRGQILGTVGNSGGSALPHLHYTLISHRRLSVPWRCESFRIVAPDGTPIPVRDTWPREGWTIEAAEPEPVGGATQEKKK